MTETGYHAPVLGPESVAHLSPKPGGLYVDGTVGGGGHALLLLEACGDCRLLAVDRDPEALDEARGRLADHRTRVRFLHARFDAFVDDLEVRDRGVDGVLLDLGVSSHQIDEDGRGFTFRAGAPLDMRMSSEGRTAAELLNEEDEAELARIFREYGEERRARAIAREVVRRRAETPMTTSDDLVGILHRVYSRPPNGSDKARVFQALRIAVNRELEALERVLDACLDTLNDGGVLVVISYHSLEDRMVKHAFREWSRVCVCPPQLPICACRGRALGETLTRKPVRASEEEVERNPRARSALLRAWRKAA